MKNIKFSLEIGQGNLKLCLQAEWFQKAYEYCVGHRFDHRSDGGGTESEGAQISLQEKVLCFKIEDWNLSASEKGLCPWTKV